MISYCGLNCSKCEALIATIENDDVKRHEVARKWSKLYNAEIKPNQINCNSCKSDGVKFYHCAACNIRRCCLSKDVDNCAVCEEYICDKLSSFIKLAPEAGTALDNIRCAQ
jgi:hypothetical protein